jgi:ribosome-associated translation inhibitor RaiA
MVATQGVKQLVRELCDEVQNKYGDIQNIDVMIEDVNGPHKAGIDKRCHLRVRGKEHLAIDADEIEEDLGDAIYQAFRHLYEALRRSRPYRIFGWENGGIADNCSMSKVWGGGYESAN